MIFSSMNGTCVCQNDHASYYPPEVNDHSLCVDNFLPDVLNNDLGNWFDLFKVSEHVKTQVANVVFKYIGVERGFDQLSVHLWRKML